MVNWIITVLILNAIFGLILFEWAWKVVKPVRNIVEERDSKYPAFRRYDAKYWSRARFYLGAMTVMPFRLFTILFYLFIVFLQIK
jgi:hypothetical protein